MVGQSINMYMSLCCLIFKEPVWRVSSLIQRFKVSHTTIFFQEVTNFGFVRFEVFTAVTMKNGVFWDVMPYGSCKNRRFEGN
jgi:hypothetical protein